MINSQWLELSMSWTNFKCLKDAQAMEIQFYVVLITVQRQFQFHIQSNFNSSNIFGTMEIVPDIGSLSHWGLIMAPGQEANGNIFSIFYTKIVCCVYSLELPQWGNSNEYNTTYIFMIKQENFTKIALSIVFLVNQKNFPGTKKWVWIIHGKRTICVWAIEVIL